MPLSREIRPQAVAVYIRWSTDEQSDGTSLEVQEERCRLYLLSQGWQISPELIFIDDGYSGGSLNRPALTRLRQAVLDGRVDCVVTYRLDRLSRNLADTVSLVRQEWQGRCVYRSATEGFDTADDSPTGALIFNILASFAEFERALIRERTYAGLIRRMQAGRYISGVVPYGYRRGPEKGTLVVKTRARDGTLTDEAAVVARIFALASGSAPTAVATISRLLNRQGIRAPVGGSWGSTTVQRILSNPVYAGHVVYGRRPKAGSGQSTTAQIAVCNTVPAIISDQQFAEVQRMLAARPGAKPRGCNRAREDYLLTTIATCPCGGRMVSVTDRHGALYYRCSRKTRGGPGCRVGSTAFRADPVDHRIGELMKERFGSGRVKERALHILNSMLSVTGRRPEIEHGLREVQRRQAQVGDELQRLLRRARSGEISPRTYEEFRGDAQRELAELADRARRLRAAVDSAAHPPVARAQYLTAMAAADEWFTLKPAARKGVLRLLVSRLTVCSYGKGHLDLEVAWAGRSLPS